MLTGIVLRRHGLGMLSTPERVPAQIQVQKRVIVVQAVEYLEAAIWIEMIVRHLHLHRTQKLH